jgi:phosphate starvation-inducible PhoH-like protein
LSPEPREFVPLSDAGLRAVSGPNSRHAALIEDAFHVLVETPGGGVSLAGDARARAAAKRAVKSIAERADRGAEVSEADVRAAAAAARTGAAPVGAGAVALGRRGAIQPKTAAQARYLELMQKHDLVFAAGPAGTGKTFLAVAHGASLLLSGAVDRLIVARPAVEAGERLGFLPGDMTEKVDPYMAPVWEALSDILGPRAAAAAAGQGRDRGRAHRFHARAHAEPRLRDRR